MNGTCRSYAFGDSDVAATRLRLLSEVFAGSTRAFLDESVRVRPQRVVDLGCGPGHSTHFLADVIRGEHVAGLDISEAFVSMAQRTASAAVSFYLHDFTQVPFPVEASDLLYARFELTHVREPLAVMELWSTQLRSKGLLLMEETEWIRTNSPDFALYLEIVEALLRAQSNKLYVGPLLDRMDGSERLIRRCSEVRRFPVCSRDAAKLFFLNIKTWKSHPYIQANHDALQIERLESNLEALTREADGKTEIEWGLRQLAFERV